MDVERWAGLNYITQGTACDGRVLELVVVAAANSAFNMDVEGEGNYISLGAPRARCAAMALCGGVTRCPGGAWRDVMTCAVGW